MIRIISILFRGIKGDLLSPGEQRRYDYAMLNIKAAAATLVIVILLVLFFYVCGAFN